MTARAVVAGVVALALLAGCGSSSPSLTRLRAQATRVCTRAVDQEARLEPPALPAATEAFLRKGAAALRPELTSLRALRAPSEQSGAYSAALGSLTRELTILTATADELHRGADPLSAIKTLQHRLAPVEADDDAAWETLRVPACVNR
jgi:hypothetical protein